MIVVAIIGILAATALPTYQAFIVRSRVSEGLALTSSAKTAVAETYISQNAFVTANSGYQFGVATKNVQSIAVDDGTGVIRVTFATPTGPLAGQVVTLTPMVNNSPLTSGAFGHMTWTCAVGGDPSLFPYVPSECRN
jgi:type IV pilus assembly protein PilA